MRPAILVIAGTDSSGGAGLTRDAQVLARFGVDVRCVVTAVTAQTNAAVSATHHIPPQMVRAQLAAALSTGGIRAIKIGMLGTCETIAAVAESLPSRDTVPIVLDPVLRSSSGASLLEPSAQRLLIDRLLPRVTLLTPNLPEAAHLLGKPIAADLDTTVEQARQLLSLGPEAVLVKGGHATGAEAVDLLLGHHIPPTQLRAARVGGTSRGTGCSLSSAIAAGLARRLSLRDSCDRAKHFVLNELLSSANSRSLLPCRLPGW